MTLHIPSWIVYTAFYGVAGSALLLLISFSVLKFCLQTVKVLKEARFYWFARLMFWNKHERQKYEQDIWEIIDLRAEDLRQENPERFKQINSRLNFGTNLDKGRRITKAIQTYLEDPEWQKHSDMESVIIEILESA